MRASALGGFLPPGSLARKAPSVGHRKINAEPETVGWMLTTLGVAEWGRNILGKRRKHLQSTCVVVALTLF